MTRKKNKRVSLITRNTNETRISVKVNLDGKGKSYIVTGFRILLVKVLRDATYFRRA